MSRRYQSAILTASYNGLQVPNAPTIGTATAGAGSASVTFTAPSNVGGGAITSYTVISSPGSILGTGSSSPITVSGLTNGTAYTFTVVATNAYGSGPASAASNSVTPAVNYIEDVFSTWLYTGNSSTQTITNGIDLAGKGGMVWLKRRDTTADSQVFDTLRGTGNLLATNQASGQSSGNTDTLQQFNSNGFNVGGNYGSGISGGTYCSWTFREQPKFFDVVTYSGDVPYPGAGVSHNLGSVPGCIICKRTDSTSAWGVWHRANSVSASVTGLSLNTTGSALYTNQNFSSAMTSTSFAPALVNDASGNPMNTAGATYVAYLFAHDAGGFGLTGTDNVISCGSFTTDGSGNATVSLGYEPQWLLLKRSSATSNWAMQDTMRGWTASTATGDQTLYADLSNAEASQTSDYWSPTSTGFTTTGAMGSGTYIYIAIRRGPMKVPTTGTSVFSPNSVNGSTGQVVTTNFAVDSQIWNYTNGTSLNSHVYDRLRGISSTTTESGQGLVTSSTAAEVTDGYVRGWNNTGFQVPSGINGAPVVYYNFVRAPGFFDEVCYTGTGVARTVTHNLGVAPEFMIIKGRSIAQSWLTYSLPTGNENYGILNTTVAWVSGGSFTWNNTAPTNTVFSLGTSAALNDSGATYVAYLFATCPGVSKVGSYTGTGALQTINCAFTTGARFVLIKRTDTTGDWYTYDSARGITSGTDPYLLLNSTAAEVTGTNYVDSTAAGFQVTAAAPAGLNAVGGTYIFLAIA